MERNIYYVDHGDTFSSVQLAHIIIPSHSCDNHFVGVAVKLFPQLAVLQRRAGPLVGRTVELCPQRQCGLQISPGYGRASRPEQTMKAFHLKINTVAFSKQCKESVYVDVKAHGMYAIYKCTAHLRP